MVMEDRGQPMPSHLPYVWLAQCQPQHSHEGLLNAGFTLKSILELKYGDLAP